MEIRRVTASPDEHATPVTSTRIAKELASRGYVTQTTRGVVSGAWDGYDVDIRLTPPKARPGGPDDGTSDTSQPALMVLEASWGVTVPEAMRSAVHLTLNDWNRQNLWPTGILLESGEGWTVKARYVANTAEGLSDTQLRAILDVALRGSISLLKTLGTPEGRISEE